MAVSVERLVRLLEAARGVDEWIATETLQNRAGRAIGRRAERSASETATLRAVIFRDSERGRGTAELWIDADGDEAQARELIALATERAALAVGPAWALPAPAAPARVVVADPDVVAEPAGVVDAAVAQLGKANGRLAAVARARIEVEWRSNRAVTSRGFASEFLSTAISFDISVGAVTGPGLQEELRGRVRSAAQLFLHRRVADAARTASRRTAARRTEPGRYDLLLRPPAIAGPLAELDPNVAGPAGYGLFAPLVAQASGEWVRLGLSRRRPGQPIFGSGPGSGSVSGSIGLVGRPPRQGARVGEDLGTGDPINLTSDGAIDLALLSAPFGELGEPVRRFEIVRAGVAAGLALDYREAALARATPNGGVRNVVLAPGRTAASRLAEPGQRPLLEIDELAWLDIDPRSGALTAGLRLGQLRGANITGGLVVGNAFDLLARARLSAETRTLGWYHGPIAMRIDDVNVIGP